MDEYNACVESGKGVLVSFVFFVLVDITRGGMLWEVFANVEEAFGRAY